MYQGGNVSLAEARERQFTDLRCAKLQKKVFTDTFTAATIHHFHPLSSNAPLKISFFTFGNRMCSKKKYMVFGLLMSFSEL